MASRHTQPTRASGPSHATAATREALGPTLIKLAREGLEIAVVDADLGVSTTAALFGREFPERFFPVGVAEQNMVGVAAGLAAAGKIAFCSTFAVFAPGRCFDQLRVAVAHPNLSVKLVASHGGIVTGEDGFSAQALEDLALMCSLPNFHVIVPADVVEAAQAMEAAARTPGPFYIRCARPKTAVIYDEGYRFELGRAHRLREGGDVTIIANGVMVAVALKAASLLQEEGIEARVLNMATMKPLDKEAIIAAARETGAIVTVEDHRCFGGLGSLVAQTLGETLPAPLACVGLDDIFGESGRWDILLEYYGLTAENVARRARDVLLRKALSGDAHRPRSQAEDAGRSVAPKGAGRRRQTPAARSTPRP
ncbi:MAG TPA: transketolase C-terminal domain-containing protein [Dehalococcoidia bacterium]|nr:transketolase C-terminal domain-containing protein [Dehalococcoidia bacterium]